MGGWGFIGDEQKENGKQRAKLEQLIRAAMKTELLKCILLNVHQTHARPKSLIKRRQVESLETIDIAQSIPV